MCLSAAAATGLNRQDRRKRRVDVAMVDEPEPAQSVNQLSGQAIDALSKKVKIFVEIKKNLTVTSQRSDAVGQLQVGQALLASSYPDHITSICHLLHALIPAWQISRQPLLLVLFLACLRTMSWLMAGSLRFGSPLYLVCNSIFMSLLQFCFNIYH